MTDQRFPTASLRPHFWIAAAWFAVVGLITWAAYSHSFSAPFHFDDYNHIVDNPAIKSNDVGEFLRFGRTRIIPFTTLAINYWVGGTDTFGYHVVNFLVHLLATLALFRLALVLCKTPRLRDTWLAQQPIAFATAAAFVFACHPIQVQAVTYLVQRISSMAALFYITAVLCYVQARLSALEINPGSPNKWYLGAGVSALAAMLSKENAASLPLTLILTDWIFFPGRASGGSIRRAALIGGFVLLIPLSWWLLPLAFSSPPQTESSETAPAEEMEEAPPRAPDGFLMSVRAMLFRAEGSGRVTPLQYLMTQCLVVPRYLRMVIVPVGFNIDHDAPIIREPTSTVVAGAALLLGLLLVGAYASVRWPLLGYGILWIFLALSIESSVLPIRDPMVEHRMYLAMPGIALITAEIFAWLKARSPQLSYVIGASTVIALATATFMRNEVWQSPVALWGDAVEKAPNKARPHVNLATALHKEGRIDQAIAHYCWALRLDPTNKQAKSNLNALSDQEVEKELDSGKAFVLGGTLGADGSVELAPKDPCEGR